MSKIKLSDKQKEVIREMRNDIPYFFNAITSYHPFTKNGYGDNAKDVHGKIMRKLISLSLIHETRFNSALYKLELTELGKSIDL